jgi:transposase
MEELKIQGSGATSKVTRRRFKPEEKKKILREAFAPGASSSITARKYGIAPSVLYNWRRLMESGQAKAIETEEELVPVSEVKKLENRVRELERALGRQTMQNDILKEAVKIAREKKLISQEPFQGVDGFF